MKVDGVLARRQIVQMQLEADARSLLPQSDRANRLTLHVLDFDLGFCCAGNR